MTFIFTAQTVSRLFGAPTLPIYDVHLYDSNSQLSLRGLQSLIDDLLCSLKQSAVFSAYTVSDRSVIISMAQTVSCLFRAYSL